MLELKLRIAETEKKYSNEHKMISSYRKKVKELQQKLREMEIRNVSANHGWNMYIVLSKKIHDAEKTSANE